jgi:hypothetical protein
MATRAVDNCLVSTVFVAADMLGSEAYQQQPKEVARGWATA